jgi:hypothetical protein
MPRPAVDPLPNDIVDSGDVNTQAADTEAMDGDDIDTG